MVDDAMDVSDQLVFTTVHVTPCVYVYSKLSPFYFEIPNRLSNKITDVFMYASHKTANYIHAHIINRRLAL